jgi:hypothetical protein
MALHRITSCGESWIEFVVACEFGRLFSAEMARVFAIAKRLREKAEKWLS